MGVSLKAKKEYVEVIRHRYYKGSRLEKKEILSEFCLVTGTHRKSAIRLLNQDREIPSYRGTPWLKPKKNKQKPGRKSKYATDIEFCKTLKELWFLTDQLCATALKAAIPEWLKAYREEVAVSNEVVAKLNQVSASTIGRLLQPSKARTKRRGGTKPGSLLRTQIPIRTNFWDVTRPGYIEADTVAHCGGSLSGEFAWTLTVTDINTTWTELRCVWNKESLRVKEAVIDIEKSLPFPILAFDADNGSEFINKLLVHHFSGKFIAFTRSRENHKNDNAHVEQKNWSHARQLLGYERLDAEAVIPLLDDLFRIEISALKNHFIPCLKLEEKVRIQSRLYRVYPKPITPYERVLLSHHIPQETKERLKAYHRQLNPIQIKREIHKKLQRIWSIVKQEHLKMKAS